MLTFNDKRLPYWCRVVNIIRNVKPPRSAQYANLPGLAGARFISANDEPQVIRVQIRVYEPNKQELLNRVAELEELLHSEQPKRLIFDDRPDRFINAIALEDFELFETNQFGGVWVTFMCHNPYWYALYESHTLLSSGDTVVTYNGSKFDSNWRLKTTFTTNVDSFTVTHVEQGKSVTVNWNFVAGDTLMVDASQRIVIINDNYQFPSLQWETNEWFTLVPGINTINQPQINSELISSGRWRV